MGEDLNVTYLFLDGHVEVQKYRYVYFMTFLIVYILIICSNCTIVYLIWKHQNLHEPMYIFIGALLLNSGIFSTIIYPKLLIDFLSEKQIISHQACIVQYFMFYSLGGSEFLLLAAMSYDRYVSICKPLQYLTIMKKRTVRIFLVLSWILPESQLVGLATLSANQKLFSFTLKVIYCSNSIYKLFCASSRAISILGVWALEPVSEHFMRWREPWLRRKWFVLYLYTSYKFPMYAENIETPCKGTVHPNLNDANLY